MQLYTKILIGMGVGALLGAVLGPNSSILPQDAVKLRGNPSVFDKPGGQVLREAKNIDTARIVGEQPMGSISWLQVRWSYSPPQALALANKGISVKATVPYQGWVRTGSAQVTRFAPIGQTIIDWTEWIGRLFLALI